MQCEKGAPGLEDEGSGLNAQKNAVLKAAHNVGKKETTENKGVSQGSAARTGFLGKKATWGKGEERVPEFDGQQNTGPEAAARCLALGPWGLRLGPE